MKQRHMGGDFVAMAWEVRLTQIVEPGEGSLI